MQPRMDRLLATRSHRRRALAATVATALALAAAGCGSDTSNQASGTPEIVTGQQVITSCFQNYFYNGILPKAAAESNCSSCVVQKLGKMGIRPTPGENEADVLTGVRLSSSDVSSLQNSCNETDANEQ